MVFLFSTGITFASSYLALKNPLGKCAIIVYNEKVQYRNIKNCIKRLLIGFYIHSKWLHRKEAIWRNYNKTNLLQQKVEHLY